MVGDIFRIAFERRHTYDLSRPFGRPWLYGIATNLVRSTGAVEARGRARSHGSRRNGCHRSTSPTGHASRSTLTDAMAPGRRGGGPCPEPERDALMLHVWEGLGYEDVADALGVPIGTVRSRLHRARQRLRELASRTGEDKSTTSRTAVLEGSSRERRLRSRSAACDRSHRAGRPGRPGCVLPSEGAIHVHDRRDVTRKPRSSPRPTSIRGSRTGTSSPQSTT